MNNRSEMPQERAAQIFNEAHKSRILAGVSYIDKLLVDVEEILTAASSQAFPKYKNPLTPAQIRTAKDYIKRLRQQIPHVLKDLEIPLPGAKFDSTHAIRVTLQFIEVAIEETSPERLAGYGKVPESFSHLLAGGLQEMKGIVRQMDSYLIQRPDADLGLRLNRLANTGALAGLLSFLAAIVDRHGLIEFRAPLSRLVEKIETPAYEIAFFGRVSAGKSSLLNRIIGDDLLPTGVTPVTAIPTRIRNRPEPALLVWTADGQVLRHEIARLADFVTEAGNPGNDKRVTRLVAEVPLAILPDDVVLVDTPGLGSLALEGASETLAYLPHCDLGVVLVDASSNLHPDDVATLDALRAASVPSLLVLSKADLIASQDLERLVHYTSKQLVRQLGLDIEVAPLSSRPEKSHFLNKWVSDQIAPRIANARRLAEESNRRKANSLAERVLHALEISIKARAIDGTARAVDELRSAETQLRETASLIESTGEQCFRMTRRIRDAAANAVSVLAEDAAANWRRDKTIAHLNDTWIQKAVNSLAQKEAQEMARLIQSTAGKLSGALEIAAQATSTNDRRESFSLRGFVKELPAPEFLGCPIMLRPPLLGSILAGLVRRSLHRQIESACGVLLVRFFNSYGRALELWFRNTLSSLGREFNSSADIYRAQLQRLTTQGATVQPENNTVLEDVSMLRKKLGLAEIVDQAESHAAA